MNAKEILAKSQAATASMIEKGTKGHKESIYKTSVFEGLTDQEKKSYRKRIRKYCQDLLSSIATAEGDKEQKLCKEFITFYQATYKAQDYSYESIASGNTTETRKNAILPGLQKVQDYILETSAPAKEEKPKKKSKK